MVVDLDGNTVDGSSMMPRVCEMVHILSGGDRVPTDVIIRKIWGLCEPSDSRNNVKQIAHEARRRGIMVRGDCERGGGYRIDS